MDDVSAFIVAVPAAEPWVGHLRAQHDPSAAQGVPAHLTLLHPFAPRARIDAAVRAAAEAIAARTAPFDFTLARIARFPGVVYVAPEPAAPFVALVQALAEAFPAYPPYGGRHAGIVPHLTVAQGDAPVLESAENALRTAWPAAGIAARADELVLIANDTGRWQRVDAFPLRGAESAWPVHRPASTTNTNGGEP